MGIFAKSLGSAQLKMFFRKRNADKVGNEIEPTNFKEDYVLFPFGLEDEKHWEFVKSIELKLINQFSVFSKVLKRISRMKNLDLSCLEKAVEYFGSDFYDSILPFMYHSLLEMPKLFEEKERYLYSGKSGERIFSKRAVCCFLSASFFCIYSRPSSEMCWGLYGPSVNLDHMFRKNPNYQVKIEKLKMILNYFKERSQRAEMVCEGPITVSRIFKPRIVGFQSMMKGVHFSSGCDVKLGVIEDAGSQALQVDFANKYVGGASVSYGCVQEEIAFTVKPELNVSRLICPAMRNDEVIVIKNCEQYSQYKGYAMNLSFGGRVEKPERDIEVVAMDARCYHNRYFQYKKEEIDREFWKCYVGFSSTKLLQIASGNWGCGAFRGDKELKFLIQFMVSSICKKKLLYYVVSDKHQKEKFDAFLLKLQKLNPTVLELYEVLTSKEIDVPVFSNVLLRLEKKKKK